MNFDPNTGQPINNNYQQPVVKKENTIAVIALVLAALGFNVISLILGILGLKKSKETNSGKGLSIAAIIISILQILVIIFFVAVGTMFTNLVWPSVKKEIVNQATCAMAYDCELNTKSEYICKYKDENNEEKEIKCNWEYINSNTQVKTTTPTKNVSTNETGNFLLPVEDIFTISGRGTVATGRVERGSVKVGDEIQVIGLDREVITTKVIGIEMFHKTLDEAKEGDNAGLLLENVSREQIERGQVIVTPNSINTYKKFDAEITTLTKEAGGRHTPFFTNYRPQFYFRTADITGVITLPEGVEMVMPGDKVNATVELNKSVAMEEGDEFSIREGGKTIGTGKVTKVY